MKKVLLTRVNFLFNLLKVFDLPRVMSLSEILKSLQGRKLKVKAQHMLVVWKVLTATIANLEIEVNILVASHH
jgi:hypothetical protein